MRPIQPFFCEGFSISKKKHETTGPLLVLRAWCFTFKLQLFLNFLKPCLLYSNTKHPHQTGTGKVDGKIAGYDLEQTCFENRISNTGMYIVAFRCRCFKPTPKERWARWPTLCIIFSAVVGVSWLALLGKRLRAPKVWLPARVGTKKYSDFF